MGTNAPLDLTLSDLERSHSRFKFNSDFKGSYLEGAKLNHMLSLNRKETIHGESNASITFDLE